MSTTYANRTNNRQHQLLSNAHITTQALRNGREVIEDDVADFLLSGLTRATNLPKKLSHSIVMFMRLSQNTNVQQPVYLNFLRALLDTYGAQSRARTCAVPMAFAIAWAEYLLDPECPDTKTSDDQAEMLLFLLDNGSTLIERGVNHSTLKKTVVRLTAAISRLEMRCSQPRQGTAVSADGGLWGNVRGHWTNTGDR